MTDERSEMTAVYLLVPLRGSFHCGTATDLQLPDHLPMLCAPDRAK